MCIFRCILLLQECVNLLSHWPENWTWGMGYKFMLNKTSNELQLWLMQWMENFSPDPELSNVLFIPVVERGFRDTNITVHNMKTSKFSSRTKPGWARCRSFIGPRWGLGHSLQLWYWTRSLHMISTRGGPGSSTLSSSTIFAANPEPRSTRHWQWKVLTDNGSFGYFLDCPGRFSCQFSSLLHRWFFVALGCWKMPIRRL